MSAPPENLAASIFARERRAVASAMNLMEDTRPSVQRKARQLLSELEARQRLGLSVGVTGPPGAGKSTLIGAIAEALRKQQKRVAVIAVDPSSPLSGGSILGDRARLNLDPNDPDIYVRSVATGGHLGGLSWAVPAAIRVLTCAFDVVLVETTGVGQGEVEVRDVVDHVILVVQPGSGDTLQFIKAGIMEIPDELVVNKADLGRIARTTFSELMNAHGAPVLLVSARDRGKPINDLVRSMIARVPRHSQKENTRFWLRLYTKEHGDHGVRTLLETLGSEAALHNRIATSSNTDPVQDLSELYFETLAEQRVGARP